MDSAVAAVPPPEPPDSPDAWYAPDVRAQYEPHPGVVVTITDDGSEFSYDVREPPLSAADARAHETVTTYFEAGTETLPRTREGTRERATDGLPTKHRAVLSRLTDRPPGGTRRLAYYVLRDQYCLGPITPIALDERVDVADVGSEHDDALLVHTDEYAPAVTHYASDATNLDRFLSERLRAYTVPFQGFRLPVVVYREHLLGADAFDVKYAVTEPGLLPGDRDLIDACKDHVWETDVDDVITDRGEFVRRHARDFLARRLTARNTREWTHALAHRVRELLATWDLAAPPVDARYARDRLDDLVYYVVRDFVGEAELTIPLRDPQLEDVEANRVGERVKVVPRDRDLATAERVPTNLVIDSEQRFVNLVTQLAASDGVELTASRPSAKVNLQPDEVAADVTIRCAVALPVISEDGPHISVRKQATEPLTPADLVASDSIPVDVVALLWLAYEYHGVVLFSGPTGVGKTTLMNAHMPFVPFHDRPISIDEGSREVWLPHETGVSLTTRAHERDYKRVSMGDLMTEANYLNPDLEVIAEINTRASFESFAQVLNTGHGVVGTTHADGVETLVNRTIEQGVPAYLLAELDLVVFPRHVDGDRFVGEVVELVTEAEHDALPSADRGIVTKGDATIHYHRLATRRPDGGFSVADPATIRFLDRLADRTSRTSSAVREEYASKRRYVQYMVETGLTDADDLVAFLADLQTNESATIERIHHQRRTPDRAATPDAESADPATGSQQGDGV